MKRLEDLDATPEKRSYWSIVNDYNFKTAVAELVDNPLDVWLKKKRNHKLKILITIDIANQCIKIDDNSGGVSKEELPLLVRPGASGGLESSPSIGIFGVGSKRSVVALARSIRITTCPNQNSAFRVEYGDDWLASLSWEIPCYELPPQDEGHTVVILNNLRQIVTNDHINELKQHLSETYGNFLNDEKFEILVNQESIRSIIFSDWSYHPEFAPKEFLGEIETPDGKISYSIIGGLISEPAYSSGEYGAYFYCNDRLIEKAIRSAEVGFRRGEAGVPHHSHSIFRSIISLHGPAKFMPWNSSKSALNYAHEIFGKLQGSIIDITKAYATLSKKLQPQWDDEVFPHKTGNVAKYKLESNQKIVASHLPKPPALRPSFTQELASCNKEIIDAEPWKEKYTDGIIAIENLLKQKIKHKKLFFVLFANSLLNLALQDYQTRIKKETSKIPDSTKSAVTIDILEQIPAHIMSSLRDLVRHQIIEPDVSLALTNDTVQNYITALQYLFWKLFKIRIPSRD